MTTYRIAVIGGTGPQGKGLAYRWARHGHEVVVGSRASEKAVDVAEQIAQRVADEGGSPAVTGATNDEAADGAEVVVLAVPYAGHDQLVASLAERLVGKVVISCVNPLGFDKTGPYGLDIDGSAAESAATLVPGATVIGAFHHVSAVSLWSEVEYLDHEDVLVCGDSAEGKAVAQELARAVTSRIGVDAGALRMARQLEPLTAVLISINKAYKVRSGIRISGL
ncbi:NADPH-dependent F420 reductase [Nocardioides donggukensis]|uniref:NADPH-dependent F420 reductase n=1 Tax=Nocardioides donggukensis TaxID=2774019 RepID=A0A927PZ74_9ACTN|nr:NADPH-dependent F420 reductase [Nocardioides donggukensis]MBD8868590.1 NADPH-dependent F420 reductase [Nocardioides donggukensis]